MCKDSPFTVAIWNKVQTWNDDDTGMPSHNFANISEWWDTLIGGKAKKEQCRISGQMLYLVWNAWKEMNRRIFTAAFV
jgi:hypothetical protein